MTNYVYTLIRFEKEISLDKRFIYNESKYNLMQLNNNFNKFFDIKLKEIDFFMKKDTMPIWAFRFNEDSINIFEKYLYFDVCIHGGATFIIYELDDIDIKHVQTIPDGKLNVLKNKLTDTNKSDKILSVNDIKMNPKIKRQLDIYNKNNLFNKNYNENSKMIILPRLRTKNIVGMMNGMMLARSKYIKKLNEKDFLNMIKEEKSFYNFKLA